MRFRFASPLRPCRSSCGLLAAVIPLAVAACATPGTRPPGIDPDRIRAEERALHDSVLARTLLEQRRLDRLALPLLRAARPLCGRHALPWAGVRALPLDAFPKEWRPSAQTVYHMGDTLRVFTVTDGSPAQRAGLREGDRLLQVGDHDIAVDAKAGYAFNRWMSRHLRQHDSLTVRYARNGEEHLATMALDTVCAYETVVVPSFDINAYADGANIFVTTAMMRFASDDELNAVIAHEMAHDALGHIKAAMHNARIGLLLGLIGDIATLAAGDTLDDVPASVQWGAQGAQAFSKAFEREADYVGLYILAIAHKPLDGAPQLFAEFAILHPESIGFANTHPSDAERLLLMESTIDEIRSKMAAGQPLLPERKNGGP